MISDSFKCRYCLSDIFSEEMCDFLCIVCAVFCLQVLLLIVLSPWIIHTVRGVVQFSNCVTSSWEGLKVVVGKFSSIASSFIYRDITFEEASRIIVSSLDSQCEQPYRTILFYISLVVVIFGAVAAICISAFIHNVIRYLIWPGISRIILKFLPDCLRGLNRQNQQVLREPSSFLGPVSQ